MSQPDNTTPIISSLLDEDPGLFDLVERYIQFLPSMLNKLDKLYQNKNWNELKSEVHQHKSTGGTYGFADITFFIIKIETALLNSKYEEIPGLLLKLNSVCDRIEQGLNLTKQR